MYNKNTEGKVCNKLKYSYNPEVTFELTKREGGFKTEGWILTETNWEESSLNEMVKSVSYLPSKLRKGEKVKEDVEEVYFLTLDFDKNDPTLEEFKEKWKATQFSWFLHTTINHQRTTSDEGISIQAIDKFRVIVPLSRPISLKELDAMEVFWKAKYPKIDTTCFDGNRYFKMSPSAITQMHNFTDIEGNVVFLNPDDDTFKEFKNKQKKLGRPKKNEETFSQEDEVILEDGTTREVIKNISCKTIIFCPFCDHTKRTHPNNHNAFIDMNTLGQYYIYCSSEGKTFWQDKRELDANKSKLFWNESVGGPSMIGYESYNGDGPLYIFKNNNDFENYCTNNNIDPDIKSYLPRREIIFNPGLADGLNESYYNLFDSSEYMKRDYSGLPKINLNDVIKEIEDRCKVINQILVNIFGKKEYLERFINWIAYILQSRKKSTTAWLITSEVQGIGKDLMFVRILMPLFGKKQSQLLNGDRIAKNFNKIDMNCFLRGYNEVFSAGNAKENLHRKESLKDLITAPYQSIEIKGVDTFQSMNFMNFILFSNSSHAIFLDEEDRRFNVIRNEDAKKVKDLSCYRGHNHLEPDIANELSDFAEIVHTLDYNTELANSTVDSEAKERLKALSKDEYEEFAKNLLSKNGDYFMLEEIFPYSDADEMMGKENIGESVKGHITSNGVIPATYMNKICKYHFPGRAYKSILDRLNIKGVEQDTIRIGIGTMKAYKKK